MNYNALLAVAFGLMILLRIRTASPFQIGAFVFLVAMNVVLAILNGVVDR